VARRTDVRPRPVRSRDVPVPALHGNLADSAGSPSAPVNYRTTPVRGGVSSAHGRSSYDASPRVRALSTSYPVSARARIGCSGWNYKSWRGAFYPATVRVRDWLPHYASTLDTVEVNNTFYRLPEAETFALWRANTPTGFVMAVKASRYLTHLKRLKDPREPVTRLFERAAALGNRLGPVLYQLPGAFTRDLDRLSAFLDVLPRKWPIAGARGAVPRRLTHVLEFRHPSWYVSETFDLLARANVSLCLHDKEGSTITGPPVGPVVYVRFHGTSGRYHGGYGDRALARWACRLAEHLRDGRSVYAYFNNDPDAVAVHNALTLRRLLAQAGSS